MEEQKICQVCNEPILENDETYECDPCCQVVHADCGGFINIYGIDTWACDNCRIYK